MTLSCVHDYRMFRFGDVIRGQRPTSITEDALNFYSSYLIAAAYGVSPRTAQLIVARKAWAHVE